jgi:8-hydroxy-5-deazaflavin:NADPH oxidoreductase
MKIGIIGSGNVGGTLGKAWSLRGHEVFFGLRMEDQDRAKSLLAQSGKGARAGSNREVASASDVILLATPWEATREALVAAGDLTGKILIDATNPLLPGLAGLSVGTTSSAGEKIAEWASGARVVKCFNTVGFNIMADPKFPKGKVALFYCGDDQDAKKVVGKLAEELGFEALDAGPLTQCRLLEPFAMLWISLAMKQGYGREIGFQLMRRNSAGKGSSTK